MDMDILQTQTIIDYIVGSDCDSFNDIKELVVDRFVFGDIVSVSLYDLDNFPNLESLTLSNLVISYDDFMCISRCSKLNKLELHNCEFVDDIEDLFNNLDIDNLVIDNTKFNFNLVNKDFNSITVINTLYNGINGYINSLDISRASYDSRLSFDSVYNITISNSQYNSNKNMFNNLIGNTKVIVNEDNSYFVEEVYE